MTALSGGQAARVGLAALLLSRYDILLLDEPTNDLDLDGLDRLERFVVQLRTGMVVVSHDREFLARCVSTVVELDLAQQRVGVYGGGYRPSWPSGSWRASMPVTPIKNSPNSAPSCGSVRAPNAAGRRRDCDAKPAGRAIRTRSAPDRSAGRHRRPGSPSPGRTAAASRPCWRCCSDICSPTPARSASVRPFPSARSTRPAACHRRTPPCWRCSPAGCPSERRRRSARCWPSSVWPPNMLRARRSRCHRASARGRRWPCCRRRVNLLVLDEPTNHLDLPAIEQLEQARDDYARCC